MARAFIPLVMFAQAAIVALVGVAIVRGAMPLGIPGEWEWLRLPRGVAPTWVDLFAAGAGLTAYSAFAGLGLRFLNDQPSRKRECLAVAGLCGAAIAAQAIVPAGAPEGYGLSKWALALSNPGSSGYYTTAREQIRDPWRFLADYPSWIKRQDALHIGTHPPGLFLVQFALLSVMDSNAELARFIVDHNPPSVDLSFRVMGPPHRADRAALSATGLLTLLCCASTVVPLYALARASQDAPTAWAAASIWPLVPSAIMFQPAADTAFPFLSAAALALTTWAVRTPSRRGIVLAFGAGLILAVGMAFTLAFLPVGLTAGIVMALGPGASWRRRLGLIAATGSGFLGLSLLAWSITSANPFVIWWWNQRNHARFYHEYPRSYLPWTLANAIELAVAIGLPATAWAVIASSRVRGLPSVSWATIAVLVLLTLSGKNLSEVARLWLPMMPPLVVLAGIGIMRSGGDPRVLAATLGLVGLQTMILQATIQVVYPV